MTRRILISIAAFGLALAGVGVLEAHATFQEYTQRLVALRLHPQASMTSRCAPGDATSCVWALAGSPPSLHYYDGTTDHVVATDVTPTDLGNWSFSANGASTSGSPMTFTANSTLAATLSSGRIMVFGDGTANGRVGTTNCYTNYNEAGGSTILQCGGSLTMTGAAATIDVQARAPTAKLTDDTAKGTCDGGAVGTLKYEVVTNVGTFYGCHQTGAATFAWVALH